MAGETEHIRVEVEGNATDLRRALKGAERDIRGMSRTAATENARIRVATDRSGGGFAGLGAQIAKLRQSIRTSLGGANRDVDVHTSKLRTMGAAAGTMASAVSAAGDQVTGIFTKVGGSAGGMTASMGTAGKAAGGLAAVMGVVLVAAVGAAVVALTALAGSAAAAAVAIGGLATAGLALIPALGGGVAAAVVKFKEDADKAGTVAHRLSEEVSALGDSFKKVTGPAGNEILGGALRGLRDIAPMLSQLRGGFRELGSALGHSLEMIGEDLAGGKWRQFFQMLLTSSSKVLQPMTRGFLDLLHTFRNIATGAMPLLIGRARDLSTAFEGWARGTSNAGDVRDSLRQGLTHLDAWVRLGKALGGVLGDLLGMVAIKGRGLVNWVTQAVEGFREWMQSAEGQDQIKRFFADTLPIVKTMAQFFGKLIVLGLQLFQAIAPALNFMFRGFNFVLDVVNKVLNLFNKIPAPIRSWIIPLGGFLGHLTTIRAAVELLPIAFRAVRDAAKSVWGGIKDGLSSVADTARDVFADVLSAAADMLDVFGKIPDSVPILGGAGDAASAAAKEMRGLADSIKDVDKNNSHLKNFGKELQGTGKTAGRTATEVSQATGKIRKGTAADFGKAGRDAKKATDKQKKDVSRNAHTMVNAVMGALQHYGRETNKALKSLGVKDQIYEAVASKGDYGGFGGTTTGGGGGGGGGGGRQRGGIVERAMGGYAGTVPGTGSGDKVLMQAAVEPGEDLFVLNRNASAMLRGLLAANQAFPRFQTGGLQPGISRLVKWAGRGLGLSVSSGLRAGDTGSLHSTGEAADLVPPSMGATRKIYAAWKSQLEELFYDPWGSLGSGPGSFSPQGIGDHLDHIHAAILGAGGPGGGGTFKKLKRLMLKGPAGTMRDAGQAGMDQVWRGANAKMRENAMASGMHGSVSMKGPLQTIAKRMIVDRWGRGQWPPFDELVMRESGWDPTAVNASSGAAGLAQALPPSKYPPGAWPYKGKSSAVKQLQWMISYISGRYGTPAGAIRFHDANNWYQRGGLVKAQGGKLLRGDAAPPIKGGRGASFLPRYLRQIRRGRSDALGDATTAIEGLAPGQFGLDPKAEKGMTRIFTDSERFGELAGIASSLSGDAPGSGAIGGHGEAFWLTRQLEQLFAYRMMLKQTDRYLIGVALQVQGMTGYLRRALRARQRVLEALKKRLKELREAERKAKGKDHKKQLGKRIGLVQDEIKAEGRVVNALTGPLPEAMTGAKDRVSEARTAVTDELTTVQGLSGVGGTIFDVQQQLRDLRAGVPTDTAGESDALRLELLGEQLRIARATARLATSELATFAGFRSELGPPYLGAFAHGLPRVPRTGLALLHEGEQVTPAPNGPFGNSAASAGDGPIHITLHAEGDLGPVLRRVYAETDRRAVATVDTVLGRRARQRAVAPGR